MAFDEPRNKKFRHSIISDHIFEQEFQEIFGQNWHARTPFKNSDIEIIAEPFRVCRISNFLKSEDFMDELKNELIDVKAPRKSVDLYDFEQSEDLANADSFNIKTFYHTFRTDLLNWMHRNTNIALNGTISMSSTCYCDTDYLLCHDDNSGDRRIAFILYLSMNWTEKDGGALDLFDTDENGLPRNVVKSLIPEYNSLVFFEVVNNSYHQVAEVTSPVKSRWSINGWFHGPIVQSNRVQRPELVINYIEPDSTVVDLNHWVSGTYLNPRITKQIKQTVEKESYIFLSNFLQERIYESVSTAFMSDDIQWRRVGPPDVRNYEVADEDSLPEILADFSNIFKSISVFQLMQNYTGLDLVPVPEKNMDPKVTIELQRWSTGCYTLINTKNNGCSSGKKILDSARKRHYKQADCNTPPSSTGDEDSEEVEVTRHQAKGKSLKRKRSGASSQQLLKNELATSHSRNLDTDAESDVSDIGDYLSDAQETSLECSERSEQEGADADEDVTAGSPAVLEEVEFVEDEIAGHVIAAELEVADIQLPGVELADIQIPGVEVAEIQIPGVDVAEIQIPGVDVAEVQIPGLDVADAQIPGAEAADAQIPEVERASDELIRPGWLDVIMQFNTANFDTLSIDYVEASQRDAALIHVPYKDNHLSIAFRNGTTCRLHKYINHLTEGYLYNLVCTYTE